MEYFLLQPVTGKGSIHATTVIYIWINQLLPTSPAKRRHEAGEAAAL